MSFEDGDGALGRASAPTRSDCSHLEELAEALHRAREDRRLPWRSLVEVDVEFHEAVARASKNQVRVAIMLGIQRALLRAEDVARRRGRRRGPAEHRPRAAQIATAITAHDAARATSLMRRHVKKFSELERRGRDRPWLTATRARGGDVTVECLGVGARRALPRRLQPRARRDRGGGRGGRPRPSEQPWRSASRRCPRHGEEPPPEVAAALLEADAAALITGFSLSHTQRAGRRRRSRACASPRCPRSRGDLRAGRSPSTTASSRRSGGASPPS